MRTLLLTALAGCTWVSEAQYDDRREELEAFRTEFLAADERVEFMTASESRFYWVSLDRQFDTPVLHSYHPASEQRVVYTAITDPASVLERDFRYGDEMMVECDFGSPTAWNALTGEEIQTFSGEGVSSLCAVAGRDVYFVVGGGTERELFKWTPGPGAAPVSFMDLDAAGLGTDGIGGLGVVGNQLLLVEGPRLWLVDLAARTATWLENADHDATGLVVFDAAGVIFDSSLGVTYLRFDDKVPRSFEELIADGGYRLSSAASDIHELADDGNYTLYGRSIVYRGRRGIFAYHLDTKKVTDILLDKGLGFEAETVYRGATVTADGTLFVQHRNNFGSEERPVYRVDLSERLP